MILPKLNIYSITFKAIVSIVIFATVFLLFVTFVVQDVFQKAYSTQEKEKISIIADYIAPTIALNVSYGFDEAVSEIAEKALNNPNVLLIEIKRINNKPKIYSHHNTTIQEYHSKGELFTTVDLIDPATQEKMGKLNIVYSNQELKAYMDQFNRWYFFGLAIFFLFILFLSYFLYSSLKELTLLDRSLKSFTPKNPKKLNLDTSKKNEISSISKSANIMIDNIILFLNELQMLNSKIFQSQAHLKDAQRMAKVGSLDYDITNNTFVLSDEYYRILGIKLNKKFTWEEFLNLIVQEDFSRVQHILNLAIKNGSKFDITYALKTQNNKIIYMQTRGKVRKKQDASIKLTAISMDITADIENKKTIEKLAYYDSLTGLANRLLLKERMLYNIQIAKRENTKLAVIFLDLDHFKLINDTLGHSVGDELLIYIAKLLQAQLRESDTLSRLGGDEFLILLPNIENEENVYKVVHKIQQALQTKHTINTHQLYITSSIGFAIYPEHGKNSDDLIRNADTAMYEAKNSGRNKYQIYSQSMGNFIDKQLTLEQDLTEAIKSKSQIEVYYQAKIDADSKLVKGAEALVRWNHPTKGLIYPDDFIYIAESTGVMIELGNLITENAIATIQELNKQNILGLKIAINLSARQFQDSDLVPFIASMLSKYSIDPSQVEFEITESISMSNMNNTLRILSELRALGVTIAIDDFGTGHSSLSYLKKFPINTLKIDKSFVMGITEDEEDRIIAQTIISMAHSLGLTTVAEGVETQEHADMLRDMECDILQGYLYSKPISKKDFFIFLEDYTQKKV